MCGIAGIYAYHPSSSIVDRDELLRIREHMHSRGPDGAGEWYSANNRVGLAHRRLAIIDLSDNASQPMESIHGHSVVTFNGEIYNYKALRSTLEGKGYRFRTNSDTEVLLNLYAEYGQAMVHHLRGMYAFGIWDTQKNELFLARDPFGIKPLYYADDGWTIRFASQVKALVAGGNISKQQEPAGVAGFYLFGSVPEPFTLYQDVRALPAGCTLTVDGIGPAEPKPFFSLSALWAEAEHTSTEGDIQETIRQAVHDSVAHHLVADVPVGAFLSAGIDSGALVGMMSEIVPPTSIKTICLAFEEFKGSHNDESPLATQVASQYGTDHRTRYVGEAEFHEDLPKILTAMDQPSIDGINTWFVSKAAAESGLKVAVSGLGGDELFGGYPSFTDIPRWTKYLSLPGNIPYLGRGIELVQESFPALFRKVNPKAASMVRYGGSYAGAYLLRRGLFMPHELAGLMGADNAACGLERLKPLKMIDDRIAGKPTPKSAFARIATLEASLYMRNQLLRDTDWASMAHSLEVRVPLVDVKLQAAIATIMRLNQGGAPKDLLGKSPSLSLPTKVLNRNKTGFTTPIESWQRKIKAGPTIKVGNNWNSANYPWARNWSARIFKGI